MIYQEEKQILTKIKFSDTEQIELSESIIIDSFPIHYIPLKKSIDNNFSQLFRKHREQIESFIIIPTDTITFIDKGNEMFLNKENIKITEGNQNINSGIEVQFIKDSLSIPTLQNNNLWLVLYTESSHERCLMTYANLLEKYDIFTKNKELSIQIVIDGINKGFPVQTIGKVSNLIGIDEQILLEILDVPLLAILLKNTLSISISERLFRICNLFQYILEVLEDYNEAKRWFTTPKKPLNEKTPLEYAKTEVGAREVEDVIGRIEYGVYS